MSEDFNSSISGGVSARDGVAESVIINLRYVLLVDVVMRVAVEVYCSVVMVFNCDGDDIGSDGPPMRTINNYVYWCTMID